MQISDVLAWLKSPKPSLSCQHGSWGLRAQLPSLSKTWALGLDSSLHAVYVLACGVWKGRTFLICWISATAPRIFILTPIYFLRPISKSCVSLKTRYTRSADLHRPLQTSTDLHSWSSEWSSMELCEDLWKSADLVYLVFRLTQNLLIDLGCHRMVMVKMEEMDTLGQYANQHGLGAFLSTSLDDCHANVHCLIVVLLLTYVLLTRLPTMSSRYCSGSEPLPAHCRTIRSTQHKKKRHDHELSDDEGEGHVERNADADPEKSDSKPWLKEFNKDLCSKTDDLGNLSIVHWWVTFTFKL